MMETQDDPTPAVVPSLIQPEDPTGQDESAESGNLSNQSPDDNS
jgi:hypothetical protein